MDVKNDEDIKKNLLQELARCRACRFCLDVCPTYQASVGVVLGLEDAVVAVADAQDLPALVQGAQHHGPDDGVQARRVASAGGHRDAFPVMRHADLLVTGEGRTDEQTAGGKLCAVLAAKARSAGASTILISGSLRGDLENLSGLFDAVFAAVQDVC